MTTENDKTFFKLVQPGTEDPGNAKPGQFLDGLTLAGADTLKIDKLTAVHRQRVLFVDRKPVCKSADGVTPDAEEPKAATCAACSETKCAPRWTVEGLTGGDVPFAIDLSHSSEKTAVQLEALLKRYDGNVGVTLTSKPVAGKLGRYFVVRTASVDLLGPAAAAPKATDDIPF